MISLIICSIDTEKFKAITSLYERLLANEDYELIGIHDARSLAEGYSRGMQKSRGDILVFCHDDIDILETDFATRLKKHLSEYDIVGVAGTQRLVHPVWTAAGWPFLAGQVAHTGKDKFAGGWIINVYRAGAPVISDIQALDGLFIAARREVAVRVGWDAETFDGFHFYDVDFSFRAYQQGYKLAVSNSYAIIHYSEGKSDSEDYKKYAQRFSEKHQPGFSPMGPRLIQVTKAFAQSKEEILEIMRNGSRY